jgi:hypothetical protein
MSRDPGNGQTIEPSTLHKYLFVGGNPVMYVDPTGFEAAEEYAVTLPLTPGMLGLGEEVSITGELTVTSEGEATVTIESIAGKVPSPLNFFNH